MSAQPLELAIDTASGMASIALSREGAPLAELTWRCERDHTRQLLPAIDGLLARLGASKDDLTAVFVCTGPGSYGGVRAGLSTAKGFAFALELPVAGVGRLEVEAYAFAAAAGPLVAVHRAGRREYAWAVYQGTGNKEQGTGPLPTVGEWRETAAPRLVAADALVDALPAASLVTGEIDDELAAALEERGHRVVRGAAALRRAALLAELGWRRLQDGAADDPKTLVPLYLREPAIGPQ